MREIPEGIEVPNDAEYTNAKPLTGRRLERAQEKARRTFLPSSRTVADAAGNTRVTPVTWQRQHMHLTLAEQRASRFTVSPAHVLDEQRRADEIRRHRIDRKRPRLLAAAARAEANRIRMERKKREAK